MLAMAPAIALKTGALNRSATHPHELSIVAGFFDIVSSLRKDSTPDACVGPARKVRKSRAVSL